jgi:hypothetical protein
VPHADVAVDPEGIDVRLEDVGRSEGEPLVLPRVPGRVARLEGVPGAVLSGVVHLEVDRRGDRGEARATTGAPPVADSEVDRRVAEAQGHLAGGHVLHPGVVPAGDGPDRSVVVADLELDDGAGRAVVEVVDDAVALVVEQVAGHPFRGGGVDGRFRVVAVEAPAGLGHEAVRVVIDVVDGAVAVAVRAVADLAVAGEGVRVVVVTVAHADAPAVTVEVEALVDGAVAVVVDAVADLHGTGEHRGVPVVAVTRARQEVVAVEVEALVDDQIAVVVEAVAGLGVAGEHRRVAFPAVPVTGGHPVAVRVEPVDEGIGVCAVSLTGGLPVAVGIGDVQHRVAVVAVAHAGGRSVHVAVDLEGRGQAAAVVVDAVADLVGVGVDHGVAVLAVGTAARHGDVPVPVGVDVVHERVAVVVDAVTGLDGGGVDRRVGVVAIGRRAGLSGIDAIAVHGQQDVGGSEGVVVQVLEARHHVVSAAVLVHAVADDLDAVRVGGGRAVIAVTGQVALAGVHAVPVGGEERVGRAEAVPVVVQVALHGVEAVAVLVDAVADDLVGSGVVGGREVIAVTVHGRDSRRDAATLAAHHLDRAPVAVVVQVLEARHRVGPVAVLVHPVLGGVDGTRVGGGREVVAVAVDARLSGSGAHSGADEGDGGAEAVPVQVLPAVGRVGPAAVLVDAVAHDLGGARVGGGREVVAVTRGGRQTHRLAVPLSFERVAGAEAVVVQVLEARHGVRARAVLVHAVVRDLGHPRVGGGREVVAVTVDGGLTNAGAGAGADELDGGAEAVPVQVFEALHGVVSVAVLVHPVAHDLEGARVGREREVVAVPVDGGLVQGVAVPVVGEDGSGGAEAVVVQVFPARDRVRAGAVLVDPVVRDLGGSLVGVGVVVVALDLLAREEAIGVDVPLDGRDGAAAVVVHAVAQLVLARVHLRVGVIAVIGALGETVAVEVHLVGGDHAVAVVVHAVALLGGGREGRRVRVGAVTLAGGHAVAILVQLHARDFPVAVAVLAVADLRSAGEDGRVAVVAVARRPPVVVEVVRDVVVVPVAVRVHAVVGRLFVAGEPRGVEGSAVLPVDDAVAVVVLVHAVRVAVAVAVLEALGRVAIAVPVHVVAGLRGAGEDGRIVVVAVEHLAVVQPGDRAVTILVDVVLAVARAVVVVHDAVVIVRGGRAVVVVARPAGDRRIARGEHHDQHQEDADRLEIDLGRRSTGPPTQLQITSSLHGSSKRPHFRGATDLVV